MDGVAHYNQRRWAALVRAGALFTRPALHLDARSARELLDPHGMLGEVAGKVVLCLASGGGKQSAAFALLGARVSVLDLSPAQLERDRQAAAHYGVRIETVQGDMRDLSCFEPAAFDIVYQPYSLNFVPDPGHVFREVAQVLSAGGLYRVECANPFVLGVTEDDWDGRGYPVKLPYEEGASLILEDPGWIFPEAQRPAEPLPPSQVYLSGRRSAQVVRLLGRTHGAGRRALAVIALAPCPRAALAPASRDAVSGAAAPGCSSRRARRVPTGDAAHRRR
jgi:SAM-dependent methyltransferase